nr:discoidin domain-containing protein [Planctomycetota bacterium]
DAKRAGVFTHVANRWADGGCMWASGGEPAGAEGRCWLRLDLGRLARVTGLHIWNYNEGGGWQGRSVKSFDLYASEDDQAWSQVGTYALRCASGTDDEAGEAVALAIPVAARWLKLSPTKTYGRDNLTGFAEVRVLVADPQPGDLVLAARPPFVARYQRVTHPPRPLGRSFAGGEDVVWPADAGVIDVTKPPYSAEGDGVADDTAALQRALGDNPDRGAIIWLPNGIYRISDTLKWGKGEKFTALMGQSERGTVIRLDDRAPGFDDAAKPKHVVWTGGDPAQRFGNEIAHLTIDTGAGNPGCAGVAFVANNQGAIHHATIISGDGQGLQGLHLGAAGENGPLLVRALTVVGFDVGVLAASAINGQTIEGLTLRDQNLVGVRTLGQHLTIRSLTSRQDVSAVEVKGGLTVLMDTKLEGGAKAKDLPAVRGEGTLYVRGLTTIGYARAIDGRDGATVDEWTSRSAATLFGGDRAAGALRLEVQELPPVAWEPVDRWASPLAFGGRADDDADDSAAIQRAIDSGATTVYLPRGTWRLGAPVVLRGKVRRFVGCRAFIETIDGKQRAEPLLRVSDGAGQVDIERINGPWHATKVLVTQTARTVIVRHCGNVSADFAGGGDVHLDDVVNNPGANFSFRGGRCWARQFNPEPQGVHVRNDGATLWILGIKTESPGTLIETLAGGATEVIGGIAYTSGGSGEVPMFTVTDARFSATLGEVCWDDRFYRVIVRETRAGETRDFTADDPKWQRNLALFTTGKRP